MFWILSNITILLTLFSKITNIFTVKLYNNYIFKNAYNTALQHSDLDLKLNLNSNNDLIRKNLNWDYKMTLEEGISKTYKWISSQIEIESAIV